MQTRKKTPAPRRPKAVTAEILGAAPRRSPVSAKWRKQYDRLLELRETLAHHRTDAASDALSEQPAYSSHMADAGTDTYDRDMALGTLSSEQDAIYQVDQAIDRIRHGTYGVCELTGKRIEAARLEAVPWTRFSTAAEKQLERDGAYRRARLGPRSTVARETAVKNDEET